MVLKPIRRAPLLQRGPSFNLLRFAVGLMTATEPAELFELKLARGGLLVLRSAIVFTLALGALKVNDVAHG